MASKTSSVEVTFATLDQHEADFSLVERATAAILKAGKADLTAEKSWEVAYLATFTAWDNGHSEASLSSISGQLQGTLHAVGQDTVRHYALAHYLTRHGDRFAAALKSHNGSKSGKARDVSRAHNLIGRAVNSGQKVEEVRALLIALCSTIGKLDDAGAIEASIVSTLQKLDAPRKAARATGGETKNGGKKTGKGGGSSTPAESVESPAFEPLSPEAGDALAGAVRDALNRYSQHLKDGGVVASPATWASVLDASATASKTHGIAAKAPEGRLSA
jgi:hypothetical protein